MIYNKNLYNELNLKLQYVIKSTEKKKDFSVHFSVLWNDTSKASIKIADC